MIAQPMKMIDQKLLKLFLTVCIIVAILATGFSSATAESEQNYAGPAVRLAAGFSHSALIDYDGSLYLWGDNTYGQAGAGSESYIDQPQLVELDAKVIDVSLGAWHTLILTDNGQVFSCGRNTFGQLGNGSWENSDQLVRIEGLSNITAISAGSYHSLALGQDGSLWVWGSNTSGQLAHAESEDLKDNDQVVARRRSKPQQIVDSGVSLIAAGGHFSLYSDQDGKVFAFGDNSKGQLGDGTTENKDLPMQVMDIENATKIEAGYEYAIALTQSESKQKLYAWGDNSLGQLGIDQPGGTGAMRTRPSEIKLPDSLSEYDDSLMEIDQLAAGYAHVIMTIPEQIFSEDPETKVRTTWLSGRQLLLVWGNNAFGQLGDNSTTQIYLKPQTLTVSDQNEITDAFIPFDAVAAGGSHSLIMSSLGQLAASGRGNQGQLGTVSIIDRRSFTPVETPDHILPAWAESQTLSAEFNENDELHVSWQPAQNNRSNTSYRLEIRTLDGRRQLLECGDEANRTVMNLDPAEPLAFTVFAYDEASEDLANDQLSLLYGSYLPEDYDINNWGSNFSQPSSGAIQRTITSQNWQADPSGYIPAAAVPWTQTSTYSTWIEPMEAQRKIPWFRIAIMLCSTLLIIAAAMWLAINFHKDRALLYPLKYPKKLGRITTQIKSVLAIGIKKLKIIINTSIRKLKKSIPTAWLKKKAHQLKDKISSRYSK